MTKDKHLIDPVSPPQILGRAMRPKGFMENPYIGKDGRDYHSLEALQRANQSYDDRMREKPERRIE